MRRRTNVPVGLLFMLMFGCWQGDAARDANPVAQLATEKGPDLSADAPIRFDEQAAALGIVFRHYSGMDEKRLYPTALGGGVAILDVDQDGCMDVFLVTATDLTADESSHENNNGLFRQRPDGAFEEVAENAGVNEAGYSLGAAVADFDNDGFPDLYLSRYGQSVVARNNGDGTFTRAAAWRGMGGLYWICSAAWFDADEDGDVDLYATTYSRWQADVRAQLGADTSLGRPMYRSPRSVSPTKHLYYENLGDGVFREATDAAGLGREDGRGLGVVAADVNRDGHIDLYVANDMCPNFLYLGRGDGTFDDVSMVSGAAFNGAGRAEAGMGVDAEDVNGDMWPDLFVVNFAREQSTLLVNLNGTMFQDVSEASGVVRDGLPYVKWGTALIDLDLDSSPDIFMTNGQVDDNIVDLGELVPYRQPALVFRNRGDGVFDNVSGTAGAFFKTRWVGRGMAFGDLDNDGDIDLVINNKDDRPVVLINERLLPGSARPDAAWIRFVLIGKKSNRSSIGAAVELAVNGRFVWRQIKGGASYLSSHDPRLLIGLGQSDRLSDIALRWPSGASQVLVGLESRRTYLVREGELPVVLGD